jgi:DNA invertase Pin-like site-specific DNA recombinase
MILHVIYNWFRYKTSIIRMKCVVVGNNVSNDKKITEIVIVSHKYCSDKQFEYLIKTIDGEKWMKESEMCELTYTGLISEYWYKLGINDKKKSNIFIGSFNENNYESDHGNNVSMKKRKCMNDNNVSEQNNAFDQNNIFDDVMYDNAMPGYDNNNYDNYDNDNYDNDNYDNDNYGDYDNSFHSHDEKMMNKNKKKQNNNEEENIQEIENILECRKTKGINNYLIKWVGTKVPTWITENDFCERDLLNEFHQFEKMRNDPNTKNRAYIYCRTSRRNSEREVSLYDQERICLDFANRNNVTVIGLFKDNGVSAKDMEKQYALNHIFKIIKKGECILFYDVTRFSRSMHQAIEKLEFLRENIGALAHSVHDRITWNNVASNRHNFRQMLSTSQLHSEIVSEKVMSSLEYKRDRGDHVGHVPYGYMTQYIDGVKTLVKNELEIKVIQYIFDKANEILVQKEQKVQRTNKKRKIHNSDYEFSAADYKQITQCVNVKYTNRRDKPFTVQYVKNILNEWKNKI